MRRFVSLLLLVLALLSAACEAEEAFVFENGATWASAPDEVEVLCAGADAQVTHYDMGFGTLTLVLAQGETHFGHIAEKTEYMFFDEKLLLIGCYYLEEDVPDAQLLIGAAAQIYGEPKTYAENETDLSSYLAGVKTLGLWNPDAVTELRLCEPFDDYPYRYYIVCMNQPSMKAFEKASIEWYDTMDAGLQGEE